MTAILKNIKRKLSRKKNLPEETVGIDVRADDDVDEIIDLVDPLEEDSYTPNKTVTGEEEPLGALSEEPSDAEIEKGLETFGEGADELEDTLEAEFMEGDVWRIPQGPAIENMNDQDLEESLLKLFDSSESFAAEIVEQRQEIEEKDEEISSVDTNLLVDSPVDLQVTAKAFKEKDATGKRPEPEDVVEENLFVDIKLEKGSLDATAFSIEPDAPRREFEMTTDKISWIESDQYYPITLQALDKKIEELKKDIENLTAEKEELKKKYECVRSILYLKDEELKKAVAKIFSDFWSLKISHMDKTKSAEFRENILIEDNGRDILVKIKGTHEDYPSIKFITEVWKDLHYSGLGTGAEGALVVNYGLEKNPKERNLAYAEDKEQLEDLIFIDARVLYNLTAAIIDADLTIEEAKRILFKKGRVEYNKIE
jgi:predicted  nucleic acid-binding Zn-ribbon protein